MMTMNEMSEERSRQIFAGEASAHQAPEAVTKVRAKMVCQAVEIFAGGYAKVKLGAVYSDKGENKDFADATPSGECWMMISKGCRAMLMFEPGKEYYVDFVHAGGLGGLHPRADV